MSLCFDIMEMIGNEYEIVKQKQYLNKHKNIFNEVLEDLEDETLNYWINYNYLTYHNHPKYNKSKYYEYKHEYYINNEDDY